jgi:hypothetical protein
LYQHHLFPAAPGSGKARGRLKSKRSGAKLAWYKTLLFISDLSTAAGGAKICAFDEI